MYKFYNYELFYGLIRSVHYMSKGASFNPLVINESALAVKRAERTFCLPDSMNLLLIGGDQLSEADILTIISKEIMTVEVVITASPDSRLGNSLQLAHPLVFFIIHLETVYLRF